MCITFFTSLEERCGTEERKLFRSHFVPITIFSLSNHSLRGAAFLATSAVALSATSSRSGVIAILRSALKRIFLAVHRVETVSTPVLYYFDQVKEPLENWTLEFDLGNCARANFHCGPLDPVLRRVLDNNELVVQITGQGICIVLQFFIVSSNVCSNACENCTSGYPVYCCQHFSYLHLILATRYISLR